MKAWLLAFLLFASPAFAVQPGEMLQDQVLEARARAISQGLRCLVCRNENIDDSDAMLARDLRILLRERLVAGDSDAQAVAYIVDRYGEYVLLNPTLTGSTVILWLAGPAMLLAGAGMALAALRRRARLAEPELAISPEETARLEQLLRD
jgi:cytochrome c-type biogenesis protein CcmH